MDNYSFILYPLAESALPEDLWKIWERKRMSEEEKDEQEMGVKPLEKLLIFLKQEVECEERLLLTRASFVKEATNERASIRQLPSAAALINTEKSTCVFCDKTHRPQDCFNAGSLTFQEKRERLVQNKRCFQCLRQGHLARQCKNFVKCFICHKRHLSVMCPEQREKEHKSLEEGSKETQIGTSLINYSSGVTLLQTLMIKIKGPKSELIVRALIDSGSQKSYIKRECVEHLGLKEAGKETFSHSLFGGMEVKKQTHYVYEVELQDLAEHFSCKTSVLDQGKICSWVPRLEDMKCLESLMSKDILLSDTGRSDLEIKLLLGADTLPQILTGKIEEIENGLLAVETRLGWTVLGKQTCVEDRTLTSMYCGNKLDISDLWRLDVLGITDQHANDIKKEVEAETLRHFKETVRRNEEGRYEVSLPWKEGHPLLLSNKDLAERRLTGLTKKLVSSGNFDRYKSVLQEWLELGVIEEVKANPKEIDCHYLPHHMILKETSATTKVRPVFDASAKDKNGVSLNECLERGPNMIELIPQIVIKFRKYAIAVIADIEKAFLQMSLYEKDRDFMRFLWWKRQAEGEIQIYRHCRVVFGVSSSPFLLAATIAHHFEQAPPHLRETAGKLKESLYVDNCLTSVENTSDLTKFVNEAKELMNLAHFNLREWNSNCNDPTVNQANKIMEPVLGLLWDTTSDKLYCNINSVDFVSGSVTKRSLLSVAQKIFDPIGLACPVTLVPKLLLQAAWLLKCRWDGDLPIELRKRFNAWLKTVAWLRECQIPRNICITWEEVSMHVFCDASKDAYAACVFIRSRCGDSVIVRLVQARSRVSPIKAMTIPRLELMAAVIATRLGVATKRALSMEFKSYYWSDSAVALTWIKTKGNWNTFVGNRCKEICQNSCPDDWRHIPGRQNPADLASRGCNAKVLAESRWWEGPEWLRAGEELWPSSVFAAEEEEVNREKRKTVVCATFCEESTLSDRLKYFSSYLKMVRMVGWIWRFLRKLRDPSNEKIVCEGLSFEQFRHTLRGELSFTEFQRAEEKVIQIAQREGLKDRITKSQEFTTFMHRGILRIKTRIELGDEIESFKHPILLPSKHHIVDKLVWFYHKSFKHAGVNILLIKLRERFWIIKARRTIKKVISRCIICKRHRQKEANTPPAPLPRERIEASSVFEVTGVDMAGPLHLKGGKKCWIALFTCAMYRALHLEIVQELSTGAFIAALRRFIARRGRVCTIFSDNGTNFVGTSNALRGLDWEKIVEFAQVNRIDWKFNPPAAPWWGGWWERLVRMIKDLLKRILGRTTVTYEELNTIICDCEATINSRPLTYISDDVDQMRALTPAMFLHNLPSSEVPDLDNIDESSMKHRWRYLQRLRTSLRLRFRKEYLAYLVHRGKREGKELQVGDVVLVGADQVKRINWPLGLIIETFPGKDGEVRVAKIKTAEGTYTRPFQRLYPLELSSTDQGAATRAVEKKTEEVVKEGTAEVKRTRTRIIQVPRKLDL
ncbi:uncharacterized protein [Rhodnius prolixus]|uniref:uncharacterized protein n=1 Tax=Rhodnius prolixus TaxID=13249 RepID=UPI003D18E75A